MVKAYELALLCEIPPGREYNICSEKNLTIRDVAKEVSRRMSERNGHPVNIKYISLSEKEIEIRRFQISGRRSRQELGFTAKVDFASGLKRLVESFSVGR